MPDRTETLWRQLRGVRAQERKRFRFFASLATLISPDSFGYNPDLEVYAYDPEQAKALLADAGYPDGFTVGMDCPNDRYVNDEAICQAVVSMLGAIGIDASLEAQTKSLYFQKLLANELSFYLLGWTSDSMDSGSVIANLMVPPEDGGPSRFLGIPIQE